MTRNAALMLAASNEFLLLTPERQRFRRVVVEILSIQFVPLYEDRDYPCWGPV
jgi:hypothetical protein